MKVRSVAVNNRKAQLELSTAAGEMLPFPYSKLAPARRSGIGSARHSSIPNSGARESPMCSSPEPKDRFTSITHWSTTRIPAI